MASYVAERAVLRFQLPHVKWRRGPRWILWPAEAWRVVAPLPRRRTLNVLQRAVLGLCRAGLVRANDIGSRLFLSPDLAAFILDELRSSGWLDDCHALTPQGRRALEEDLSEPIEDMTVGWVFADPLSGQLWPRFHAGELPYAQVERETGRLPRLLSGSIGDPRREDAFEVRLRPSDRLTIARPLAEEVLRAARTHRLQLDREERPVTADSPALQRISFVLEEPTSCLLAVRVWLPLAGDWQVDDPFGVGESLRLRRWIEERNRTDMALRDYLEPFLGVDPDATDVASLARRAERLVEERLSMGLRLPPELQERLVTMQRALLETELDNCPPDKWDDVAVKAQRAAERALLEVKDAHPPTAQLAKDETFNEMLLEELARALGFEVPLPPSLIRVRRGKIVHAFEHGSGSLRALLLLALFGTAGVSEHPLARAARVDPRLLHRLDDLATTRDRSAHEGVDAKAPLHHRRQWIRDGVETVFSTVKLLFSR